MPETYDYSASTTPIQVKSIGQVLGEIGVFEMLKENRKRASIRLVFWRSTYRY